MSRRDLRLQDIDEEDTEEGLNRPLEIGGFVTPVKSEFTVETPKATLARDLLPDQAILFEDRPYEVTGTKHTMAKSGPLDSRYKVAIELIELFDKSKLDPLILRATEQLKRVNTARVRYTVVCAPNQLDDYLCRGSFSH